MMSAGAVGRLLGDLVTAQDEATIIDLLTLNANAIAELPPRERERAYERIADAIRERRHLNELQSRRRTPRHRK